DHRRDLGRRVLLAADLDDGEAVLASNDFIRDALDLLAYLFVPPSHKPLDREDRVLRIGHCLPFRHLPNEPLAVLRDGDAGTGRKRLSVNSMSTALRFTRAAFGAVQRASPGLASRWAERLFCSPPRRAISERMAAWLAGGRRFDLMVGGRRVAAWSWGDRGPGVLLVHGWGSRGARFVDLGGALLASGVRVIPFDAPGHGASPGRLSSRPA